MPRPIDDIWADLQAAITERDESHTAALALAATQARLDAALQAIAILSAELKQGLDRL